MLTISAGARRDRTAFKTVVPSSAGYGPASSTPPPPAAVAWTDIAALGPPRRGG